MSEIPTLEQRVPGERQEKYEPTIRLVPFDEIQFNTQPRDLVRGLIPREGLVLIYGPAKCGKSFWTFDLAMHVALGREYRGLKVQQGAVVYGAFEGQSGFQARAEAYRRHYLTDYQGGAPFYLVPMRLDLVDKQRDLISAIAVTLGGEHPKLVVLDTLNRSFAGSESSDEDMTSYVQAADAIRESFSCAVIIIHHSGYDRTHPRGRTSLVGAIDASLCVDKSGARVTVVVEVAKDGPDGGRIVSRLETLIVDHDDEGTPITSCVIVPDDNSYVSPPMRVAEKVAFASLVAAVVEVGRQSGNPEIPLGTKTVSEEVWRAARL